MRKSSAEVNSVTEKLKERLRSVSAASQEHVIKNDEEQARVYVETREKYLNDVTQCLKKSKFVVQEMRLQNFLDKSKAKRTYQELNESDIALVRERATLAANRVKLQYGILSHTSHARIGEAYLAAIAEYLPEPSEARIKK